jgi:Ala-tRNA(Pro) deacylase
MAISPVLRDYLDREGVQYQTKDHALAYTSRAVAEVEHIPEIEMAKSVILIADEELVMAVLPARYMVRLEELKKEIGCQSIRLATEDEFRERFQGCDVGAMFPFGNLWGVSVFCDRTLEQDEEIEFNAGTHTDSVRMRFEDFKRLAQPRIGDFVRG